MARFGYIFNAGDSDRLDSDKQWMQEYGCIQIIEEMTEHEKLRSQWKQLMANIDRGDEALAVLRILLPLIPYPNKKKIGLWNT